MGEEIIYACSNSAILGVKANGLATGATNLNCGHQNWRQKLDLMRMVTMVSSTYHSMITFKITLQQVFALQWINMKKNISSLALSTTMVLMTYLRWTLNLLWMSKSKKKTVSPFRLRNRDKDCVTNVPRLTSLRLVRSRSNCSRWVHPIGLKDRTCALSITGSKSTRKT